MMTMFCYKDGSEMRLGDAVLIEEGQTKGTIKLLVVTSKQQEQWTVPTPGVLVSAPPYGNVFLPDFTLSNHPIEFVERHTRH